MDPAPTRPRPGRARRQAVALLVVVATLLLTAAPPAHADPGPDAGPRRPSSVTATSPLSAGAAVDPHVPGWAPDLGIAVRYQRPVAGTVRRAFDRPSHAFGAGHRGVDLEVEVGGPVHAAGPGTVRFAGPVAGRHWVSIAHPDGHLTTYGPLQALRVRPGQTLRVGAVLGALDAGGHGGGGLDTGLHWGARDHTGGVIDPLSLLGDDRRPSLIGGGRWEGTDHQVRAYEPWAGGRWAGTFTTASPAAVEPGFAVPPNPNHLIVLPGLASSSRSEVLDTAHLGYDPRSVTAFSYAGRADGQAAADDPRRDQLPYGPQHTWEGPGPAAALLAEQLRAQALREPGRAVDLIGHSMGGVVILRYLLEHHDPYDTTLPPIGHVVTIGSPLRGSDLAVVGEVLGSDVLFGPVAGAVRARVGSSGQRLPLDAPAIEQLATGSGDIAALGRDWHAALAEGTAGPMAMGTRLLTIGGSRDLVVTPERTQQPMHPYGNEFAAGTQDQLPGMEGTGAGPVIDHRVLPGGHTSVLETEAVREVTWRFLAGEEVVASPGRIPTSVGDELGTMGALSARMLQLWGLWRAPAIRIPAATRLR